MSQKLEADKPADVNEIVMGVETPQGSLALLEGLSSNFFAVYGGKVYTAAEGVLPGTVRDVVLSVCERHQIPVVLEVRSCCLFGCWWVTDFPMILQAPVLSTLQDWEGAFISSTSRLVLPLNNHSDAWR